MKNTALGIALVTTGLVAISAQQAPDSRQAPTFRVEVNYVEIDATVTDAQGNFVRGLTKEDFELVEEGQPQTISTFTTVDLPFVRTDPPLFRASAIEPDVRSNIGDFDGRVILIALDDLQTEFRRSLLVRRAAAQFVRRFVGPNDLAAVVTTGGGTSATQDFTNSHSRLLAAIEKFAGQKPRRDEKARADRTADANIGSIATGAERVAEAEMATRVSNSLRVLGATAEFLGSIRGRRKAVIWFAEGVEYDTDNVIGNPQATRILEEMRAAIAAATRAGVSFYAVDPRGVGAGLDEAVEIRSLDEDYQKASGMVLAMNETRNAQNFLRTMSSQTGGFAVVNQNDLNDAFGKIIQENSSYYLLGYHPSNDQRDGRFRKVLVRVKRPGLQVKFRQGYTAPKGKPTARQSRAGAVSTAPELRAALESPLPVTGLGMRVFAAPFAGTANKGAVAVVVEFDPTHIRFQPAERGTYSEDLELIILPVRSGKPLAGGRDEVPLRLTQRNYDAVRTNGLRILKRLDLPPGHYQLHVAAKAINGNAVGGVTYDLEVPDFSKPSLSMSGIALMSASANRIPTPRPDKAFLTVVPGSATALREFPAGDTLSAHVEVYDTKAATPHAVEIRTSVTADDGRVVFNAADGRRADEMQGKRGGFAHTVTFPLAGYRPGRYVLRIDARAQVSNGASAARELEFRVR